MWMSVLRQHVFRDTVDAMLHYVSCISSRVTAKLQSSYLNCFCHLFCFMKIYYIYTNAWINETFGKKNASWPAFKPMFWNHDIRFFNHQVGFNYCNMIFVRVVYNIFSLRIDKMHLWHVQMVQNITLGEHLRKWRPFSNMAASMRNDSVLPKSSMTGHKSFHL